MKPVGWSTHPVPSAIESRVWAVAPMAMSARVTTRSIVNLKRVLYLIRIWDVAVDWLAVCELLLLMDPTCTRAVSRVSRKS